MTHLDISAKGLEGPLDLSDFSNLEYLDCSDNCLTKLNLNNCRKLKNIKCSKDQLTTLTLSNLEKLEVLNCYDNYLTQIIYPSNPEKITWLEIQNNNLSLSDLSIFSRMRNLERLIIGNSDKNKISKGIYNKIEGSLGSLKDLNKLERLIINNTDIKAG
ncbi:18746_t:CDS:1 [Racocetra persica]|uniref:18746_t:CDS:1 n=1 Tax=Racocetra persica TaxID=160502 RepID=A0ACA9QQF8_9GLOM|nr:18746_t:CDS:1 [Racocetra persica]